MERIGDKSPFLDRKNSTNDPVIAPEGQNYLQSNCGSEESAIDFEAILFQELVNEGKHFRVLQAKRPQFTYDEKQLREAAAAEVAMKNPGISVELDKSRKRKHLSADEKAKQNRDRNREHAKNTRLRKKAYVAKLKTLVDQLSHIKEVEGHERKVLGERIHASQVMRKNIVRTFLAYQSLDVCERSKWAGIVDEGIIVSLPITPFRWFHKADIVNSARMLVGIDALMRDNASMAFMAREICRGKNAWKECVVGRERKPLITFHVDESEMIAAGDLVMCSYVMTLDAYAPDGTPCPCSQSGMVQCNFNKSNKIVSLELIFDVMGFMQHLQRTGLIPSEGGIVPNTLSMALQPSKEPRIIVRTDPPYTVVHSNDAWHKVKGIKPHDSSQTIYATDALNAAAGPENPLHILQMLIAAVCSGRPVSSIIRVLTGDSGPSPSVRNPAVGLNYIKVLPLSDRGDQISHALLSIVDIPLNTPEAEHLLRSNLHRTASVHSTAPVTSST